MARGSRRGWFIMPRGWMEDPAFRPEPFTEAQAFAWSIEQAAYQPHIQWFNGSAYEIDRGEFVTSWKMMMSSFGWAEKRVRLFINRMVKAGKWAKRGAHRGAKAPTVLIICNYELFQTLPARGGEAWNEQRAEAGAKQGRSEGEAGPKNRTTVNGIEHQGTSGNRSETGERRFDPDLDEAVVEWEEAAQSQGWNPANVILTGERRRKLRTILDAHGLEGWRGAIARARSSELLGTTPAPAWFHLTWLLKHDNFLKVMDGNYDERFAGSRGDDRPSGWRTWP